MSNQIGKGLKELLNEYDYSSNVGEAIIDLPLEVIRPNPYQPRYLFDNDKIEELAVSIKEHGVFQPIIVKKMNGYYAIVSGERRYRACLSLGLETIPAIVRMYEKEKMIQVALIENLQREDLSPIEEAKGYLRIMRELDLTQKEVGVKVGKSRSHVTNMLGLLNLPDKVLELVDNGKISMGHARVLSKLEDVKKIEDLAKNIVKNGYSVREVESLAKEEKKVKPIKNKEPLLEYKSLEKEFEKKYQLPISIAEHKITIKIKNKKDLDQIIKKLME